MTKKLITSNFVYIINRINYKTGKSQIIWAACLKTTAENFCLEKNSKSNKFLYGYGKIPLINTKKSKRTF